jgi:hypothetical protein
MCLSRLYGISGPGHLAAGSRVYNLCISRSFMELLVVFQADEEACAPRFESILHILVNQYERLYLHFYTLLHFQATTWRTTTTKQLRQRRNKRLRFRFSCSAIIRSEAVPQELGVVLLARPSVGKGRHPLLHAVVEHVLPRSR